MTAIMGDDKLAAQGVKRRKLSKSDAREIRMSMDTNVQLSRRYGVTISTLAMIRRGDRYGALAADERTAQRERQRRMEHPDLFRLEEYLLIVGDQRVRGGHMDRQEAMDALYECRHGRLSHDPSPACGCWRGELAPVFQGPTQQTCLVPPTFDELCPAPAVQRRATEVAA